MREEEEPLSPWARGFLESSIDCGIVIKFGCKTKINPNIIIASLKLNVFKHSRFCSVPNDDGTKWLRRDVNVEEHVYVPDIDVKDTEKDGEWFVEEYISHIAMIPLDKSKPLWEFHILNIKTSDAEAICVIRSHHSLGDGISLVSLLLASTRKTSDLDAFPPFPVLERREPYNHRNKFSFLTVWSTVRLIWNTLVDFFLTVATLLFLIDTKTSLKDRPGALKNFSHRIVSFDDIKLIKNAMKMTVNDVLLRATQAALTRYLHQSYDMMAKGSKCRWGNHISIILFPFTIALQSDPLLYLSNAKAMMDRKKHSLNLYLLYAFIKFVTKAFGAKVAMAFPNKVMLNTTMTISNIPGPPEEVSFEGHPIAYFAPSVYGLPQALTIHFATYANKMVISVTVDPMIIDAHKLCDELEESLKIMKVALLEKGC